MAVSRNTAQLRRWSLAQPRWLLCAVKVCAYGSLSKGGLQAGLRLACDTRKEVEKRLFCRPQNAHCQPISLVSLAITLGPKLYEVQATCTVPIAYSLICSACNQPRLLHRQPHQPASAEQSCQQDVHSTRGWASQGWSVFRPSSGRTVMQLARPVLSIGVLGKSSVARQTNRSSNFSRGPSVRTMATKRVCARDLSGKVYLVTGKQLTLAVLRIPHRGSP